jgi:F-type H+-transporting ATPase subunit epsilon
LAEKTFRCRLITPDAQVMDSAVTAAVLPSWDGQMGFLPSRAPIVTRLGIGELRLDFPDTPQAKGGSRSYLVEGGFAHMLSNHLTILAERATPAEQISETEAQRELAAADAKVAAATDTAQRERVKKERERAAQKLSAARAFKARGGGI